MASLAAAEDAIELADSYGICDGFPLDESQKFTLRAGLGERANGTWAATQVADFKGRQGGGKSDAVAARELAGLILFEEPLIIHTAHEFGTANESFLRLVAVFENWDDLRRRVRRVLYGNGTQSINLLSGQRILYKARTGGAGRGFTKAALVVYDEAQHLQAEHLAASGPARLAYPNSQSWYAGSGGLSTSVNAWRMRRRALSGNAGRLAYCEGTAEDVSLNGDGRIVSVRPNPEDRDRWGHANPGLGRWVQEEDLAALFDELGPELFARECMCVWDPEPGDDGKFLEISEPDWLACHDPKSGPLDPVSFALDVAEDRSWSAIGIAARSGRGGTHVELSSDLEQYDYRPGTDWVVARAKALHAKWGRPFGLVKGSPAWSLESDLRAAGVEIREVSGSEFAQACGQLFDAAVQHTLRHLGQPALTAAVANVVKKTSGDAFVWDRRNSNVDISPLVAVTVAKFAADQHVDKIESGLVDPNDWDDEE